MHEPSGYNINNQYNGQLYRGGGKSCYGYNKSGGTITSNATSGSTGGVNGAYKL